jgi:hypothetical protein
MDARECAPIDAAVPGRPGPSTSFNKARSFTSAAISATGEPDIRTDSQMARSNIQAGRSRPRSPSSRPIVHRRMSPLVRSLASRTRTRQPSQG